jgi:diaminohydroxyphosphoribosylaminopyrimidine deaminase / 5-amino-6-(5-phosphoribosylamino)uracil reductase
MNHDSPNDSIQESIVRESFLALGFSSPNPPVAAVITDESGRILVSAHTQRTGFNHAEREVYRLWGEDLSLSKAKSLPHHLFVSLEPCTHFGRTAPCRDLILDRKPKSISVGCLDPNPLVVEKRNSEVYQQAGIEWKFSETLKISTKDYLEPFITRITHNRPKIILKTVVSKEGNFAPENQGNFSISNAASNRVLSLLRSKVDCILVGPKTVTLDNPSLDFRIPNDISELLKSENNNSNYTQFKSSDSNDFQNSISIQAGSKYNPITDVEIVNTDLYSRLIEYSKDSSIWKEAIEHYVFYQPKRAFVIDQYQAIDSKFIEKQIKIQEALRTYIQENINDHTKSQLTESKNELLPEVIFFLLEGKDLSSTDFSSNEIDRLLKIPNSKIIKLESENFGNQILDELNLLGVNLLLIEGGNLLYKEFFDILQSQDEILYVQNNDISIPKGKAPVFADKLKNAFFQKEINSDTWKVFKKEELCLQV